MATSAHVPSQLYERLFESVRDAIVVTDPARAIIDCNPAFEDLFGYSRREITGRETVELYADEADFERIGEELDTNLENGKLLQTVDLRKKSGEVFPAELHGFYLKSDQGEVVGYIGVIRDVTHQRETRRALERSERRYRELFEEAPIGIFRTHSSGRVLDLNQTMAEIMGFDSPSEALETIHDLAHQIYADPDRRKAFVREIEEHGSVSGFEVEVQTVDGESAWFEMSARIAERHEDGSFEIQGFNLNITERKREIQEREALQAQLVQAQKMESVGRLAGGVAHDFNNMLSVIIGHARLAMQSLDADSPLQEDLSAIHDAAERSSDLTRQLLTFARKQVVHPEVLDLNRRIESLLTMHRRLIGEEIELTWDPADSVWSIEMDPGQIDQILANLLVNARDAIVETGRIEIRTKNVTVDEEYQRIHPDATPRDYVLLEVSDTGRGIEADQLDRIFEPFFTTKSEGEGTGLGLATIYGIVRQNEGFVNVYSEVGLGTTFRLYLPRTEEPAEGVAAEEVAPLEHGQGETILVVEDQPTLLRLVEKLLVQHGYSVLPASTAREALRIVEEEGDDVRLVLADVVLPDMTGQKLVDRIESQRPEIEKVFMSGYPAGMVKDRGVLPKGTNYIQKPFTGPDLIAKIQGVLQG